MYVADSNDWVNVNYVVKQASSNAGNTAGARQNILGKASGTAKSGPWSQPSLDLSSEMNAALIGIPSLQLL